MFGQQVRAQLNRKAREMVVFFLAWLYFYPWSYKTDIKQGLKYGSLTVVSLSTLALLAEVTAESFGSHIIAAKLAALSPWTYPAFLLAVGYLIWHDVHEMRKPGYEYTFVQRLCDFLQPSETEHDRPGRVPEALKIFHGVFRRSGIAHVSVFRPLGSVLRITPEEVYPAEKSDSYYVSLRFSEGVAGKVFLDGKLRYVPRLSFPFRIRIPYLPGAFFPHAMMFSWKRFSGGVVKLIDEDIDFDAFVPPPGGEYNFESLLSVPIFSSRAVAARKCLGVLNFDFWGPDPLAKADIEMAAAFGILLAEEFSGVR